jgi:hypothetical protein
MAETAGQQIEKPGRPVNGLRGLYESTSSRDYFAGAVAGASAGAAAGAGASAGAAGAGAASAAGAAAGAGATVVSSFVLHAASAIAATAAPITSFIFIMHPQKLIKKNQKSRTSGLISLGKFYRKSKPIQAPRRRIAPQWVAFSVAPAGP